MPKKQNRRGGRRSRKRQLFGNGTGPSQGPRVTMMKKFNSTTTVRLENATSNYSYYSDVHRPNFASVVGHEVQFAAYELWRIKKLRVSIQLAGNANTSSSQSQLNSVANTVVWTAADWGMNETMSGETIMQYQNAKKNTLSLNNWTKIIDTSVRVNASLGDAGSNDSRFIMPADTWLNTAEMDPSVYSGYQIFIQNFSAQSTQPDAQPMYTLVTEYIVEFMQPSFQNNPSAFSVNSFNIKMKVIPDGNLPDERRTYCFNWYKVEEQNGQREFIIHLVREDGQPGSLTYTGSELRDVIKNGRSGKYFGDRPIIYDGPVPPTKIPIRDYAFGYGLTESA